MKSLRLWILVVLAVVLPLRGALAAAMMCAPIGIDGAAQQAMGADCHAGVFADATVLQEPGERHHASTAHAPGGHDDRCNVCAASCSIVPLLGAVTPWPEPPGPASATFPEPMAPVARFLSDGPDRPPRHH